MKGVDHRRAEGHLLGSGCGKKIDFLSRLARQKRNNSDKPSFIRFSGRLNRCAVSVEKGVIDMIDPRAEAGKGKREPGTARSSRGKDHTDLLRRHFFAPVRGVEGQKDRGRRRPGEIVNGNLTGNGLVLPDGGQIGGLLRPGKDIGDKIDLLRRGLAVSQRPVGEDSPCNDISLPVGIDDERRISVRRAPQKNLRPVRDGGKVAVDTHIARRRGKARENGMLLFDDDRSELTVLILLVAVA